VEDSELESIAAALSNSWKEVGVKLRIDPSHLDYLERQNSPGDNVIKLVSFVADDKAK
jgi:hypothetical protein